MSMNSRLQVAAVRSAHRNAFNASPVRVLAMLLLFCTAAVYEAVHLSSLADADVWWHLSTGIWILQNHAVPHSAIFSQYSTFPWTASSWGYDALLAAVYKADRTACCPAVVDGSQGCARDVGVSVGARLASALLVRCTPWPSLHSALFWNCGRCQALLIGVLRYRIGAVVSEPTHGKRATALLAASAIRLLGKPALPVRLRTLRTWACSSRPCSSRRSAAVPA